MVETIGDEEPQQGTTKRYLKEFQHRWVPAQSARKSCWGFGIRVAWASRIRRHARACMLCLSSSLVCSRCKLRALNHQMRQLVTVSSRSVTLPWSGNRPGSACPCRGCYKNQTITLRACLVAELRFVRSCFITGFPESSNPKALEPYRPQGPSFFWRPRPVVQVNLLGSRV